MAGTNKKHGVNPVIAAVTGAVVGGIAVAGALTLSDEKKREQVKDALIGAKDKVLNTKEEAQDKLSDARDMAMDKAEDIKDAFHHAAKDIKKSF